MFWTIVAALLFVFVGIPALIWVVMHPTFHRIILGIFKTVLVGAVLWLVFWGIFATIEFIFQNNIKIRDMVGRIVFLFMLGIIYAAIQYVKTFFVKENNYSEDIN